MLLILVKKLKVNEDLLLLSKLENKIPNILLIDEVDVFFNREYYGNSYNIATSLKDETISNLIDYIWNNRYCCWMEKE